MAIVDLGGVAVKRVVYEAEGWGEGELWLDGPRVVWHELPRARATAEKPQGRGPNEPRRRRRVHPHPGGVKTRLPLGATLPGKRVPVGNGTAPTARRLLHSLQRFFAGERVSFDGVELDLDGYTAFQLELTHALRAVPYGEVISYGELAAAAGHPNAQRAAGTFCAHNRYPLIVPCHRVVSSTGVGSYGSLGVDYKRRLLELEGVAL
jgi:methylated-DNA-[protein]-cysteine S-methyltransferase